MFEGGAATEQIFAEVRSLLEEKRLLLLGFRSNWSAYLEAASSLTISSATIAEEGRNIVVTSL